MRLFSYIEDFADKGRISRAFKYQQDKQLRENFDLQQGHGREFVFAVRENCSDSMFINTFLDQDFVDLHKLFVAGKRLNKERMTWQYYVQSRNVEDYKKWCLTHCIIHHQLKSV